MDEIGEAVEEANGYDTKGYGREKVENSFTSEEMKQIRAISDNITPGEFMQYVKDTDLLGFSYDNKPKHLLRLLSRGWALEDTRKRGKTSYKKPQKKRAYYRHNDYAEYINMIDITEYEKQHYAALFVVHMLLTVKDKETPIKKEVVESINEKIDKPVNPTVLEGVTYDRRKQIYISSDE
jgi:hypothetical protein